MESIIKLLMAFGIVVMIIILEIELMRYKKIKLIGWTSQSNVVVK